MPWARVVAALELVILAAVGKGRGVQPLQERTTLVIAPEGRLVEQYTTDPVTRALARDPDTPSIPVLMCTSKSNETDRIWGLRQGARDYLTKPIDEATLMNTLKTVLVG